MKLSVIIIEFHCMEDVKGCVASVGERLGAIEVECLVVVNSGYAEEQLAQYRSELDSVRWVIANDNLGYAGGVNLGLAEASGEYVYVLNPDCRLTDDGVIAMMDAMSAEQDWGIAGPRVVDGEGELQPSCRRFPRPWTFLLVRSVLACLPGAGAERRRYLMEDYDRESDRDVDWVSGGAVLVKRSALDSIGDMDTRYFLYMEDVDWCHSSWLNGYSVRYFTGSTVVHAGQHQSISGGIMSKLSSAHVRWHLKSMASYFAKFGLALPKAGPK